MRLTHSYDRHSDLPTRMDSLSRETSGMLLATLNSVPNGEELYLSVLNAVELDWNDKTHNVCTEFIQSSELGIPDCTRLTITVTNVTEPIDSIDPIDEDYKRIETVLTVSVLLGHLHTEYHIRYIPVDWSLSMMKTVENDFPQMFDQYAATYEMRDDTSLDPKTRQEARNTTYAPDRVLWDWNLSETIAPLRFYPNRDPRFDRYKISI